MTRKITTRKSSKRSPVLRSKLEARCKEQLDDAGLKYEYEQVTLNFQTPVVSGICKDCGGKHVAQRRRYLADFTFGPRRVLEVKGYLNSTQRSKILGIRKSNPDVDFRLFLGADNKIAKGSTTRYSDWCKDNGIPYCVRTLPREWIEFYARGDDGGGG